MAKQCGIIKLTGTIGNVSFFKTKDGYLARMKGGGRQESVTLQPALPPGTTLPVFLALSIQYLKEVNSTLRPVITGDHHTVTIIAADSPRQTAGPPATRTQHPPTAPVKYIRKDLLPSAYPNPRAPHTRHRVPNRPPFKQSRTKIHSPP